MGAILALALGFAGAVVGVAMVGGWFAWRTARLAKRGLQATGQAVGRQLVRRPALEGPARVEDADLLAYPQRLEALEARLVERHDAVQAQLRVLSERSVELAGKPDRADLVARYEVDIGHLDRRAASIRRVLTLVWRTRSILLLRVHLAVTGRRRPTLAGLPKELSAHGADRTALARARTRYEQAAADVAEYLRLARERFESFHEVVPPAPLAADVDDATRAALAEETARISLAYGDLIERMDRLADNLVWLGDHAGTLEVVEDALTAPTGGPHGESAAHLLGEVSAAVARLNELASAVDHQVVGKAMEQLQDDVGRLETAGLEEQAAAAAEIEVARLVEGFHT